MVFDNSTSFRNRLVDLFEANGHSLHSEGLNNWAFTREKALFVIQELDAMHATILGGDVYDLDGGRFKPAYENWYCDPLSEEAEETYRKRANAKARTYIHDYPNAERLFVLVVNKM